MSAADLARAQDWSDTDLGPREAWPASVEQVITALLESPVPMSYQHGPRFAMVYNDAFAVLLGDKHPAAFGRPTPEVVQEVWENPAVGPKFERVLRTGQPFVEEGARLLLRRGRDGAPADVGFYMRAGSAVRDATGRVVGVLHVVVETTEGVRLAQAIAELASALAVAVTVDDVTKAAMRHALTHLDASEALVCLPQRSQGAAWKAARRRTDEPLGTEEERLPLIWTDLEPELVPVVKASLALGEPYAARPSGLVVFPMEVDDRHGAFGLRLEGRELGPQAATVVETSVRLVGQAIGRAQLYDHERTTAELLQRTLLPQTLPEDGPVLVAARYEAAPTGSVAGGDFYDAFALPDGRLAMVIGDVVGRGVNAAIVMGQIRAATRGAALNQAEPSAVFGALDHMVAGLDALRPVSVATGGSAELRAAEYSGELFVTMLYGVLDPGSGRLAVASAGHFPPALLRAADEGTATPLRSGIRGARGDVQFLGVEIGPPLGIGGDRPVLTTELRVGDVLLGFTDGLLERRNRSLMDGELDLLAVLGVLIGQSPRTVCQQVVDGMSREHPFEDDCALLAVGRAPVEHRRARLVVPPLPEAVRPAREWARRQLGEWDVEPDQEFAVVTGLSELVTNAVLHAATDAHVTMDLDEHRLTVTVSDNGSRGTPLLSESDLISARGRGLGLVRAVSDSFGMHRGATGSTVWFEVGRTAQDRAGAER